MTYYPTLDEDLVRAKAILAEGSVEQHLQEFGVTIPGGTIYGKDIDAAYKLLESFVEEIERQRRALQRIMQCLGPSIPELVGGAAEGMQAEIAEALGILHNAGIEYQYHEPVP